MKTKLPFRLLSICMLVALILTSCSKDSDPQSDAFNCQIKEINFSGDIFTSYEFNYRGLVSKVNVIARHRPYNTTGYFTYDKAGKLLKRESVTGNYSSYYAYRYDNGLLSEMDYYEQGERIYTDTFTYDENNRPVKVIDDIGNVTMYTYYDDGNLKDETLYESGVIVYKVDYADYDDKETPLKAIKGEITPHNVSKNNPRIEIENFYDNGVKADSREVHHMYQYNNNNLPTSKKTYIGGTEDFYYEETYNYTCD